jgi:serine protease
MLISIFLVVLVEAITYVVITQDKSLISNINVTREYEFGFAADLTSDQLDTITSDPSVIAAIKDYKVYSSVKQSQLWGLLRINTRRFPLPIRLPVSNQSGTNVNVYVLDTGIDRSHQMFTGPIAAGKSFASSESVDDENGHGTHVSGLICSQLGVTRNATLVPVRVLDQFGRGMFSAVLAGVDWVNKQHRLNPRTKSVLNLSLGGQSNPHFDQLLNQMVENGVVVVVAAGNEDQEACNQSPASCSKCITVAASTMDDSRASFSNFGSCVDIFAPGDSILSTWLHGQTKVLSGTSMAAPFVSGIVASLLSVYKDVEAEQVRDILLAFATRTLIKDSRNSPSLIAYNPVASTLWDLTGEEDHQSHQVSYILLVVSIILLLVSTVLCLVSFRRKLFTKDPVLRPLLAQS